MTPSIAWNLITTIRALPSARQQPDHHQSVSLIFRALTATGTLTLASFLAYTIAAGKSAEQQLSFDAFHVLDAATAILLVAAVALIVAAIIFFPPVAFVTIAGGGTLLVLTPTAGFVTVAGSGTALGLSAVVLNQAANNPSGPNPPSPIDPGLVIAAGIISAAGDIQLNNPLGADQPPSVNVDHHQYRDLNNELRWKDTNQLVNDVPNRPIYQETDGTWRWGDTQQSIAGLEPQPRLRAAKDELSDVGRNDPDPLAEFEVESVLEWSERRNNYLDKWHQMDLSGFSESIHDLLRMGRGDEAIKNALTPDDAAAVIKETRGVTILKPNGTPYDHLREARQAFKAVSNQADNIDRLALTDDSLDQRDQAILRRKSKELRDMLETYSQKTGFQL